MVGVRGMTSVRVEARKSMLIDTSPSAKVATVVDSLCSSDPERSSVPLDGEVEEFVMEIVVMMEDSVVEEL